MKKRNFLVILFALFISLSPKMYAVGNEANTGSFEMMNSTGEAVTVHYSVTPAYPDKLAVMMNPSASFTLSSRIVDTEGNEKIKIKEETVTARYANSIDISSLTPGSYFIEVVTGNEQPPYRIAFTK